MLIWQLHDHVFYPTLPGALPPTISKRRITGDSGKTTPLQSETGAGVQLVVYGLTVIFLRAMNSALAFAVAAGTTKRSVTSSIKVFCRSCASAGVIPKDQGLYQGARISRVIT
jgi:hypothetical protein